MCELSITILSSYLYVFSGCLFSTSFEMQDTPFVKLQFRLKHKHKLRTEQSSSVTHLDEFVRTTEPRRGRELVKDSKVNNLLLHQLPSPPSFLSPSLPFHYSIKKTRTKLIVLLLEGLLSTRLPPVLKTTMYVSSNSSVKQTLQQQSK